MSVPDKILRRRAVLPVEPVQGEDAASARLASMQALSALKAATPDDHVRIWSALSHYCNEGILICDAEQSIIFVNPAFERVTGYTAAEAIGQTPRLLQSGQQNHEFYSVMWSQVLEKGAWRGEICNRRKNGELYMEWLSLAPVRNAAGEIAYYIGVFSDLTQRKHAEDTVRHLVSHDILTQLPNRNLLSARLAEHIEAADKSGNRVALLLLDLDNFKDINESMGHEAGDLLLQTIGARLTATVRRTDVVARLGGDEFAIALPEVKDATNADFVAQKLLAEIEKPLQLGGRDLEISGSVGICLYPDDARDVSEMIRNADTAMYRAKSAGRGSRQFYTDSMSREARARMDLESDLLRAIRQQQFVLYYQPQLDVRTGEILSVEALIRWNRPGVGLVMPNDFIAFAEERELIAEIGDWTLGAAAEQAKLWDRHGLPPFGIAVNVSASQFHLDGFVARLANILHRKQLSASRMELEITEGVIMRDSDATIDILKQLNALGVSLSIDDFGTGYSSLSYLRRFPIDEIKIDRSFVNEMTKDEGAAGIVRGIIELAHSLKLQVIAEGVETCEQLKRLMDLKCDRAQGFLISRPLPAAQLERFVEEWPKRWKTMTG